MPALARCLSVALLIASAAQAQTPPMTSSCDLPRGKDVYQMCSACHSLTAKEPAREGPSLAGLFGRQAGGQPGFPYSTAMRNAGWRWTPALLETFLSNPRRAVRGTTMTFNGVKDAADRAAVVCYITAETAS